MAILYRASKGARDICGLEKGEGNRERENTRSDFTVYVARDKQVQR